MNRKGNYDPKYMKENWDLFPPPMVPIYFISKKSLARFFDKKPFALDLQNLNLMLGYFEDYEEFEMASLVRDAIQNYKLFADTEVQNEESKSSVNKDEIRSFFDELNQPLEDISLKDEEYKAEDDIEPNDEGEDDNFDFKEFDI